MTQEVCGEGIILRKKPYGEYDEIIDIFTQEEGLITLISKGGRKMTSKMIGILERGNAIYYERFQTSSIGGISRLKRANLQKKEKEFSPDSFLFLEVAAEVSLLTFPDSYVEIPLYEIWKEFINIDIDEKALIGFLCRWARILGLFPDFRYCHDTQTKIPSTVSGVYWDFTAGIFLKKSDQKRIYLDLWMIKVFHYASVCLIEDMKKVDLSKNQSLQILQTYFHFLSSISSRKVRSWEICCEVYF